MDRERQHVGALPEGLLDAVAVVRVDVDVGDAQTGVLERGRADRDGEVVVDAEAGGPVAVRVVQAAGGVERAAATPPVTSRSARKVAPAASAAASCMPAKAGVSPMPMPSRRASPAGSADALRTAAR